MKKKKPAPGAPALHIPREHQSAPKEHWADKEVAKAAEEIRSGQFVPAEETDNFLAVGLQRGAQLRNPAAMAGAEKLDLVDQTSDSMLLAQHPRVQDALRRLATEKREGRNSQEILEKTQMLHELNERAMKANQWDGQGRWLGKENEKMRVVNIMQPFQFLRSLEEVIGEGRVFLNRFAVLHRVALLAPENVVAKPQIWTPGSVLDDGRRDGADKGMVQVGTLQYPCGPEWMVPRFDAYGVPTTAKYLGWRTALLSMIDLRVITEKEAHTAFPLGTNPASAWYREQLFMMRSRDGMVA
jgi:hypothetical protein